MKLQRWVDLLAALLRRNYPVRFEELKREVPAYGASDQKPETLRRMFERDKDELRRFGVPIETRDIGDGELGYALSRRDFYLPYLSVLRDGVPEPARREQRYGYRSLPSLTFEPDELTAIAESARRLQQLGVTRLARDARSAVRKLGCDLPVEAYSQESGVRVRASERVPDATFDALATALAARKHVTFFYTSIDRGATSPRWVAPYGLFFLGSHWYLAAVAPGEPVKNFRLSRMSEVKMNPRAPELPDYIIPPEFRLAEHARSRQAWELGTGDAQTIEILVLRHTGATAAALRLGEAVEDLPDHRRFRVLRHDVFARWLLGFAGDIVPVNPPSFVERWRQLARETLALYERAP